MFSVIIPVYNREGTISICVKGILNTIYKDFEVILIDDGSSDNSFEVCRELANQFSNVRCYTQKNGGVSSARNRGLKEAKGKYILFADSDDTFYPNSLFDIEQLIEIHNDFVVYKLCRCIYTESGIKFQKLKDAEKIIKIEGNKNITKWLFTDYNPYINPIYSVVGKIFLTDIIRSNNISFNENVSLGEDQIFVCTYLKYVNSMLYIDKPFYQTILWPKEKRSWGLSSVLRSPEDFLYNQKENYLALNRLYEYCKLSCVKEYAVNYIMDRPITRIIHRHSILANKQRVSYVKLIDYIKNNIKPLIALEYPNIAMVRNKNIAKYATMIMKGSYQKVVMLSYIEQNLRYYIIIPIWRRYSRIKHLFCN